MGERVKMGKKRGKKWIKKKKIQESNEIIESKPVSEPEIREDISIKEKRFKDERKKISDKLKLLKGYKEYKKKKRVSERISSTKILIIIAFLAIVFGATIIAIIFTPAPKKIVNLIENDQFICEFNDYNQISFQEFNTQFNVSSENIGENSKLSFKITDSFNTSYSTNYDDNRQET